jgi:hypothetical protein
LECFLKLDEAWDSGLFFRLQEVKFQRQEFFGGPNVEWLLDQQLKSATYFPLPVRYTAVFYSVSWSESKLVDTAYIVGFYFQFE